MTNSTKPPKLTRDQAAIIGAFTGITCGPFSDIHDYAERKLGRLIWTHQIASKELMAELKNAARDDFIALAPIGWKMPKARPDDGGRG
jgi:D-serine deaminase-like pyridoxal phosphate-dependent protein